MTTSKTITISPSVGFKADHIWWVVSIQDGTGRRHPLGRRRELDKAREVAQRHATQLSAVVEENLEIPRIAS